MVAATIIIEDNHGDGVQFKVIFTADTDTPVACKNITLQLATRTADNLGFYHKTADIVTADGGLNGHAIFALNYQERVDLFSQEVVDNHTYSEPISHLHYRYTAKATNDDTLASSTTAPDEPIGFQRQPDQPSGITADARIEVTGHDEVMTFTFYVHSISQLTNMKQEAGTVAEVEVMFNSEHDHIQNVICTITGDEGLVQQSDAYVYKVSGQTIKGTGSNEITLKNNAKYEVALRCANVTGKSQYSKVKTVTMSNELPLPHIHYELGNAIAYLDDVYTSYKPGVYDSANDALYNKYDIANVNETYAAQMLVTLLDVDIKNPDVCEIEFGVLSDQAIEIQGEDLKYPDSNVSDGLGTESVIAFVTGKHDTYKIESGIDNRYKNSKAIIRATEVTSYTTDGTTTNTGHGDNKAGYAGLMTEGNRDEDSPLTNVDGYASRSNDGLFVRKNWYNPLQTDIVISARTKQTTLITNTDADGVNTTTNNVVYGRVKTLGKVFSVQKPSLNPPRLNGFVRENDGMQYITCNIDGGDEDGIAGTILDEDYPTVSLVISNNNGLDLTLMGGYGYAGSTLGSGYNGDVTNPTSEVGAVVPGSNVDGAAPGSTLNGTDHNQCGITIDGTKVKFGMAGVADGSVNYQVNYTDIYDVGPASDADGASLPDTQPSREFKFSLYQGDANKTMKPHTMAIAEERGKIIQHADEQTILLHPFKTASAPAVVWTGMGVNELPTVEASQENEIDNYGFIFQTLYGTSEDAPFVTAPEQPIASDKYRAIVRKQSSGPVGVDGALAADDIMADFLFNGDVRPATATNNATYQLPMLDANAAIKIPGNIGDYEVKVEKLLKLSTQNFEFYKDFYRWGTTPAISGYLPSETGLTPLVQGGLISDRTDLGNGIYSLLAPHTTKTDALYYESPTITSIEIADGTFGGNSYNNNTMVIKGNTGGAKYTQQPHAVTSIGFVQDTNDNSQSNDDTGYSLSNISTVMNTNPNDPHVTSATSPFYEEGQPGTAVVDDVGYDPDLIGHYDYTVSIEHPGILLADLSGGATFDGLAFVNSLNADSAITLVDGHL